MEHKIDATEKKLGRVAAEAASFLMGKSNPNFQRNEVADVKVNIENASKLDIAEKKFDTKEYKKYSGYPGGLKIKTMKQVVDKKGYAEILQKAIHGMLPNNKLRAKMMKNLVITE